MTDMESAILEFVSERGGDVLFLDLEAVPGFAGDLGLEVADNCLIAKCSAEAAEAIISLTNRGKLEYKIVKEAIYHAVSRVPILPVAQRVEPFAELHWLPVAFGIPK